MIDARRSRARLALWEDRKKSLDAGMNDHLTKPFEIARLRSVLDKWLAEPRGGLAP